MTPEGPSDPDVRDDAAALIAEVGRRARDARRYRALATSLADPVFDRVLAIGSEIRRADRAGRPAPIAAAVEELRELLHRCEEGVRNVRAGASYRELLAAHEGGVVSRVTELAAAVFTDVSVEAPTCPLHWVVPLAAGRGAEHFIAPERCAELIREAAATGVRAPADVPDMGGDASIRPIPLLESVDPSEGPITLAWAPAAVPGPIGRLAESEVALWYGERLLGPFTVEAAPRVSDEWWQIRPAAYAAYVESLGRELADSMIPFEIAPNPPGD